MSITIKNNSARAHGFFYGTKEDADEGGRGKHWKIIPTQEIEVTLAFLRQLQGMRQFREAVRDKELIVSMSEALLQTELPLPTSPRPKSEIQGIKTDVAPVISEEPLPEPGNGISTVVEEEPEPEPEVETTAPVVVKKPKPKQKAKAKKRGRPRKK